MRIAKLNQELEVFIAGTGAAQSLLMAFYSFFERKRDFRNLLLFVFFLAITLRITKSLLWVYLDTTPLWLINLGFAAHAFSGPALFLYALYFLFQRKWSQWNLLHFLPAILLMMGLRSFSLEGFWYEGGYSALLAHQLIYSGLGSVLWISFLLKKNNLDRASMIWITSLILGTALLQFLYFSNYILGITPYLLGPLTYLPLIYFLAFLLFKNPSLLHANRAMKHQNIRSTPEELHQSAKQIEALMKGKKLYLDPNCTLGMVAQEAKLPAYLVSHIVNNTIGKSFPDFLNGYRVEEIKLRLVHPDYKHTKIASIAYDCGFNTLSSFNTAFKKATGTTPTQFQKSKVRA